tara:strand:+ start:575 stop:799 length:225 start_codon:yes stop_codon:yes gene_type:complete
LKVAHAAEKIKHQANCTNDRLRNKISFTTAQGLACCAKVLHDQIKWQQVYAIMLIGYARVSTQDQDRSSQETVV